MRVVLSFVAGLLPGFWASSAARAANLWHTLESDADLFIAELAQEIVEGSANTLRGFIRFAPYTESAA